MRSQQTKRTLLGASAAIVIVAAIVVGVFVASGGGSENDGGSGISGLAASLPKGDLGLALTASKSDALGVDPKAGFVLTAAQSLSAAQVRAALTPSPAVPLDVEEKSGREFRITPARDLEPDSLLKLVFKSPDTGATLASWAYQVRAPLRVVSTVPNNERTFVALNTGIEVTFSTDEVVDPQASFSITPPVQGRFEQHKRTLVFVPQALEAGTLYTVTIKPGVAVKGSDAKLDEPFSFAFETAPTRTPGPPPQSLGFQRSVNETGTAEAPLIAISTQDAALRTLPVQVYAYPDARSYIADLAKLESLPNWSSLARDSLGVDPAPLRLAMTVTAEVLDVRPPGPDFGSSQPYLRFPAPLPAGMYLMQAQYQGKTLQAWLQVTDVATYVTLTDSRTVVWTNDVAAGTALGGVKVELAGTNGTLGTTSNEGVVQFDTPKDAFVTTNAERGGQGRTRTARGALVVTDAQGRFAVVPLSPNAVKSYTGATSDYQAGVSRDYWHFLSADRPIYQTTDKVNVFGVVRAREGEVKRELIIDLQVSSGEGRRVGVPQRVMTDDYGAFTATVALEGVGSGYYAINVRDSAGNYIDSLYVQASQYVKPAYRIEARASKLALFAGEEFDLEIEAKFFDGSPVSGAQVHGAEPGCAQRAARQRWGQRDDGHLRYRAGEDRGHAACRGQFKRPLPGPDD